MLPDLPRTRLLVSVRSVDEARQALAGGVDWIDVKEPLAGSLGPASAETIAGVAAAIADRVPVSAALGELADWDGSQPFPLPTAGVALAKLGVARCGARSDWRDRLRRAWSMLPPGTKPAAVVYADWKQAQAPPPEAVLEFAAQQQVGFVLVDTWDKRRGGLLTHWNLETIAAWLEATRRSGVVAALAGSLTTACVARLVPLYPEIVAVRAAACREGRASELDPQRVRQLVALVHSVAPLQTQVAG